MTVKELIDFLSRENPNAKVTLTSAVLKEDNGYGEAYYEDRVFELEPWCLSVDILGDGIVDILVP